MSQSEAGSGNQNQQTQQVQEPQLPEIKVMGFNVTELLKQHLPAIEKWIDSRIEAKFKEFLPHVQEAVRTAMDNYVKNLAQQFGIQIPSQNPQTQSLQSPNPASINPSPSSQIPVQGLDFITLVKALGLGSGSLTDELKKYAELKSIAEAIAGRGPSISDVVKAFIMGQNYTLRMLYLMTRGKWEKVEETLFGGVEKLFGEGGESK